MQWGHAWGLLFYLDQCLYLSSTLLPHTFTSISHDSASSSAVNLVQTSIHLNLPHTRLNFEVHRHHAHPHYIGIWRPIQHSQSIQLNGVSWGSWWIYPALPACPACWKKMPLAVYKNNMFHQTHFSPPDASKDTCCLTDEWLGCDRVDIFAWQY